MDDVNTSIAARAANGEAADPDPELFPMGSVEGDAGVTVKTLIKAGLPVEFTMAMRSAEVPVRREGMLHPERQAALLVRVEPGKAETIPVRECDSAERKLTGWKVRQTLRPVHITRLDGNGDELEANFAILVDADPRAAGVLLERMQRTLSEMLAN